jgi:hypothetical protein
MRLCREAGESCTGKDEWAEERAGRENLSAHLRGWRPRRPSSCIVYRRRAERRHYRLYKHVKATLSLPAEPERVATLHAARIDKQH